MIVDGASQWCQNVQNPARSSRPKTIWRLVWPEKATCRGEFSFLTSCPPATLFSPQDLSMPRKFVRMSPFATHRAHFPSHPPRLLFTYIQHQQITTAQALSSFPTHPLRNTTASAATTTTTNNGSRQAAARPPDLHRLSDQPPRVLIPRRAAHLPVYAPRAHLSLLRLRLARRPARRCPARPPRLRRVRRPARIRRRARLRAADAVCQVRLPFFFLFLSPFFSLLLCVTPFPFAFDVSTSRGSERSGRG